MIWAFLTQSKLARYAGAALAFLLAVVTFGKVNKRKGKKEAIDEMQEQDQLRADAIRNRVRNVERVQPDDLRYRD